MRAFFYSVAVLIYKEALMIFKDKRGRLILVMPVLIQTLLFGYVATFELNRVDYAVLDEDRSQASRDLIREFDGSPIFHRVVNLNNADEIAPTLDRRQALLVLHVGASFEHTLNVGRAAPVQILVDGRNSNVAGIAAGYGQEMIARFNQKRLKERLNIYPPVTITSRAWFNPNLETRWNILSGLLAVLSVLQVMILAGQSVAREKETGTFDQLLVTPLTTKAMMLGKAIPPVLVGVMQSSLVLFVAVHWFLVPFSGSFLLLLAGLLVFNSAIVGIGLCISVLTTTMQQALLYTFSLLMPMILLSGFISPVSSMPEVFQWATLINPVRYGVNLTQRIYLEGAGFADVWRNFAALFLIAAVTWSATSLLFRTKMGGGFGKK
ncbi:MAG: ABC transporter permease [Burkholderiales bacterium]|jgi:ABC-2 type transport system permease protein|nr:ABC transporter permease [Burkholderiales bacterium]